jgi:butyrate kinase
VYRILVVNPGSTSTKIAAYGEEEPLFSENIPHPLEELKAFASINDQYGYRLKCVEESMARHNLTAEALACVVGRGGMLPPIKAGGYIVNAKMKDLLINGAIAPHASNLGGLIAAGIAEQAGIPAYIYDGVSSDEFEPIARVTGIPEIRRNSFCHVLNSKAIARKYAESLGKKYEDLSVIVAHLGGGVTVSAHKAGRIVDSLADDIGPFSPERAGSVPVLSLIDLIYDHPDIPKQDMMRKIRGMGGLRALLGTSDAMEIERRIDAGDKYAKLCYDAMIYQFAKGIGLLAATLKGEIDAVIITGGLAKAPYITEHLVEYVKFLGHVEVIKGEFENEALALGALRILRGEEQPHVMG